MPDNSSVCQLPPDKVRISASYHTAVAGSTRIDHPESVEIVLNEGLPADPAELCAFLRALLDSLFRDEQETVGVDFGPSAMTDEKSFRAMSESAYPRGGRVR
jgi:hypothetical protein